MVTPRRYDAIETKIQSRFTGYFLTWGKRDEIHRAINMVHHIEKHFMELVVFARFSRFGGNPGRRNKNIPRTIGVNKIFDMTDPNFRFFENPYFHGGKRGLRKNVQVVFNVRGIGVPPIPHHFIQSFNHQVFFVLGKFFFFLHLFIYFVWSFPVSILDARRPKDARFAGQLVENHRRQ